LTETIGICILIIVFNINEELIIMQDQLGQLAVGDEATVSGFTKGAKEYRAKLLAMGLTKGVKLQVTRVAPLGDPLEISVRGFSLSLRKAEAAAVLVERSGSIPPG
jgi:ferrous iron transport protein A